jgi:hypothetical protein
MSNLIAFGFKSNILWNENGQIVAYYYIEMRPKKETDEKQHFPNKYVPKLLVLESHSSCS